MTSLGVPLAHSVRLFPLISVVTCEGVTLTGSILLINPSVSVEPCLGVSAVFLDITPLLAYCHSGFKWGSNSFFIPWTSGTVSPLAFSEALIPTQKVLMSHSLQKLTRDEITRVFIFITVSAQIIGQYHIFPFQVIQVKTVSTQVIK